MKVFISSLIGGMEPLRAAARDAVSVLGHEPVMAEDFGVRVQSPQIACLDGLRQSGIVVLILGASYGAKQRSGLSATYEEYREAKGSRPVIAFVQEGVDRDSDQAGFVKEVQAWEGGLFRGGFRTADELRALITRGLHEWELANAAGPVNPQELLQRALNALPDEDRGSRASGVDLILSIAAGPSQTILRPSEIEKPTLADDLLQAALFGPNKIFSPGKPSAPEMEDNALILRQGNGTPSITLDPQGSVMFRLPVDRPLGIGPVIIQEDVEASLTSALRYASWLLDRIDPSQRLTHVALAATFSGAERLVWRTRSEQQASPNSYTMGWGQKERRPVHLTPPHKARAALALDPHHLVEDLATLLRRAWKN